MTTSVKNLIPGSVVSISPTVYYIVPKLIYTKITQMLLTNNTSQSVSITIYLAQGEGAPAVEDIAIPSRVLAPNEVWVPYPLIGAVLSPGNTIQAVSNTADAVIIKASGLEIS